MNEKLKIISSLINKDDIVLDIGTDHGLLPIYLKKHNLCKEVYASDISSKALTNAKNNFKKHKLKIKSFVSDGFKNIDVSYNTGVISGMGTSNIIKILTYNKLPNRIILSSNNEHYKLRKFMNKLNYSLKEEIVLYENKHYYIIMLYEKGKERLKSRELKFGKSKNILYYKYLYDKNKLLLKKVPFKKRIKLYYENLILKVLIEKK